MKRKKTEPQIALPTVADWLRPKTKMLVKAVLENEDLQKVMHACYMRIFTEEDIIRAKFTVFGDRAGRLSLRSALSQLLRETSKIASISVKHWDDEGVEFCKFFEGNLDNWLKANNLVLPDKLKW